MVSYIADDTADTIYKGGAASGRTQKHRGGAPFGRAPGARRACTPVVLFLYMMSVFDNFPDTFSDTFPNTFLDTLSDTFPDTLPDTLFPGGHLFDTLPDAFPGCPEGPPVHLFDTVPDTFSRNARIGPVLGSRYYNY